MNEIKIDTEKLISKLTPNEKEEKHFYTIADDQIRYRRNLTKSSSLFNEEWISIDRNSRTMNHYYISKDKSSKVTKFPLDRTTFRDIKVTYETKEDKNDKKIILGYECFRVIVTETIIDAEYGTEVKIYDMYVTNQIDLPFHLLNTTLKQTIDSCPLQLSTFRKDKENSFSIMKAVEIRRSVMCNEIQIPQRFTIR